VIVVIDLHAAEIDQRLALSAGVLKRRQGLRTAPRKDSFSFYIHSVRLEATLVSGFRQANGIEDAGRHAVAVGGAQDLGFARVGGRARGADGSAR